MKILALAAVLLSFSVGCLDIQRQKEQLVQVDQIDLQVDVSEPDTTKPDTPDVGPDTTDTHVPPDTTEPDTIEPPVCDCDDDDPCTENVCLEGGCDFIPIENGLPCEEDGDPCTWNVCVDGVCQSSPRVGETLSFPSLDAVTLSHEGDLLLAGTAQEWSDDLWLSRVSATPDKNWERTYEDWDQDRPAALTTSDSGDLVVVGTTEKPETDDDMWLFTATPDGGMPQVDREFGEVGNDQAYCVSRHPEGGYVLGGYAYGTTAVIRTDEFGIPLWQREFEELNGIFAIVPLDDGFYLVSNGQVVIESGKPKTVFHLVRTDLKGNRIWTRSFQDFSPRSMALGSDGLVIAGQAYPHKGVMKVSKDGQKVLWTVEIPGGIGKDALTSVSLDPLGGIYVGGSHNNSPYAAYLNSEGEVIWDWTGGGEGKVKDVVYLDGGMVVVGQRNKTGFWAVIDNGFECYPE